MPVGQSGAAGGGFVGPADGLQYLELRNHIAARIAAGELNPGDRLPSERQLQTASLLARGTIREGLSQLEAEGLIYRKDRSGDTYQPLRSLR
jgi:DNA-binding GntR family transcriptional regulator